MWCEDREGALCGNQGARRPVLERVTPGAFQLNPMAGVATAQMSLELYAQNGTYGQQLILFRISPLACPPSAFESVVDCLGEAAKSPVEPHLKKGCD